jgi:hypothetical protein
MLRDALEAILPPLYSQEALGEDAVVRVHLFNPCGTGDWWITECAFRRIRPPVPVEISHLVRPKSAACSG